MGPSSGLITVVVTTLYYHFECYLFAAAVNQMSLALAPPTMTSSHVHTANSPIYSKLLDDSMTSSQFDDRLAQPATCVDRGVALQPTHHPYWVLEQQAPVGFRHADTQPVQWRQLANATAPPSKLIKYYNAV